MKQNLLNQDINYLQGQVHGLQALLLGMANLLLDPMQFQEEGLKRLSAVRDAVMSQPVQETTLAGIDATETWLRNATE